MVWAVGAIRTRSIDLRILGVLLLTCAAPDPALAGWLDKLKEALGTDGSSAQSLSTEEIGTGLKKALRVGTDTVVAKLGKTDGFNLDPEIHIPLPSELDKAKAKALFLQAVNDMTLDDVMAIYRGPDDAATEYFRGKMAGPLALEMKPVVDQSLSEVGAVNAYNIVMTRYDAVPFAPEVDANLSDYVVGKGMDGIFYYLAREEAAIRQNPAKRTTDILKQVFGSGE